MLRKETKTEKAMEMLSLFEDPKYREKKDIARKIGMSIRQVYRAEKKLQKERHKRHIYVDSLDKWKANCHFLYTLFTQKWMPDPEKEFSDKEVRILKKIEADLEEYENEKE